MPPTHLVDTSALARMDRPPVHDRVRPLMEEGLAAVCGVIELEVLWTARGRADLAERRREMAEIFAHVDMVEADFADAKELMYELAERGKHRAAGLADLLISACARRADLAVLHYDSDFEAIAAVTGLRAEWVVPRGSVP